MLTKKIYIILSIFSLTSCMLGVSPQNKLDSLLTYNKPVIESNTVYLNGNVYDSTNNQKQENVIIKVNNNEVKTDANGFYSIANISIGKAVITAYKSGYKEKYQELELQPGVKIINFFLEPDIKILEPIKESMPLSTSTPLPQPTSSVVISQRLVKVKGEITDHITRKPLEGVLVQVGNSRAITDKNGRFQMNNVLTGNQLITLSKDGYDIISEYMSFGSDFRLDETLSPKK